MDNFKETIKEIQSQLKSIKYDGDLGDIGNEVGVIIAKYFNDDFGFDKESFIHGLNHGISLTDGTHE